jgi:CheY-like chemotaxis protein
VGRYLTTPPTPPKLRCHVLSIRHNPGDERLLAEFWGNDAEIEIITVASGGEALAYLRAPRRNLPNLLVLAAEFSGEEMTALQTLRALKSDAHLRCVPVIVLAGLLSPTDIRNLYEEQAACVIEFPSTLDRLERMLNTLKELWLNDARLPYQQ